MVGDPLRRWRPLAFGMLSISVYLVEVFLKRDPKEHLERVEEARSAGQNGEGCEWSDRPALDRKALRGPSTRLANSIRHYVVTKSELGYCARPYYANGLPKVSCVGD